RLAFVDGSGGQFERYAAWPHSELFDQRHERTARLIRGIDDGEDHHIGAQLDPQEIGDELTIGQLHVLADECGKRTTVGYRAPRNDHPGPDSIAPNRIRHTSAIPSPASERPGRGTPDARPQRTGWWPIAAAQRPAGTLRIGLMFEQHRQSRF